MITVTIKKTGTIRKAWRVKITAGNGEPLPDPYTEKAAAVRTAKLMFGAAPGVAAEPVRLRVHNEDGTISESMLR